MKNIDDLMTRLATLQGKQASNPVDCVDPAEAGTKTDVNENAGPLATEIKEPTGAEGGIDGGPEATSVAKDKLKPGDKTPPAAESFTVEGAAAKSAATQFAAKAQELRSKLAAFSSAPSAAPAATAEGAPKQASDDPPVGYHHRVLLVEMLKSARCREMIEEALTENIGMEAARKMVKSAASEFEDFEVGLLNEKIAAYEQQVLQRQHAEQHAAQADHLHRLLKEAKDDEARDKILFSAVMIKQAAERFSEHEVASQVFAAAVSAAEKVANDMAGGMPPEQAAAGMEAGGEPTIEELLSALAELVQSGQITEEEATQIVAMLEQSMGGGGDPAAGGMDPGMGAPPPGMEEMPKAAYVKLVADAEDMLGKVASILDPEPAQ